MHHVRRSLAILILTMCACHRPVPVASDAGAPAHAPDAGAPPVQHAPEPDPSSAMAKSDAGTRRPHRRASSGAIAPPAPADPHVLSCTGRPYKDWPSVRDCIAAEAPAAMANAADAGHKLGAAARPDVAANPAWLVPAWYVNATTGNNANTCVTSGSPCHDYGEIVNRWQTTSPVLGQGTVLNLLADDTTTLVIWNPIIVSGGRATILGATTTVATGTFGTVTPKLRTRTPNPLLQINLGANASIAQGMMLVDSTHAGVAWVDSCVSSVCTISQPLQTVVPTPITFPSEVDSFTAGDSYTLQRPVKAYIGSVVPTTVQLDQSAYFVEYVEHVWGVDPAGAFCGSVTHSSSLTKIAESRFDTAIAGDALPGSDGSLQNVMGADEFGTEFIQAGAFGFGGCLSTLVGLADADVIFHGLLIGPQPPGLAQPNLLGFAYCDGGSGIGNVGQPVNVQGNVQIAAPDAYGASIVYGSCNYDIGFFGTGMVSMQYTPTATSTIVGTSTLTCSGQPFANAYDATVDPAPSHPARSLTLAALDQPVASGGFAGYARCDNGGVITSDVQATAAPAAYVTPVPNGGTGRDAGGPAHSVALWEGPASPMGATVACSSGQVLTCNTAADPTFQTTSSAVSSVTGSLGVNCSPTTGAVNCTNTGVASVTAGTAISLSGATGAVTITNTGVTSAVAGTGIGVSGATGAVTFSNTGATSVTGTSGVSCSPTTGAVSCSNTGVTSVTAGSGISVSAATGGVTITNTGSAAVTSVTGSSGVTCSPTTGSVVCSVAAPIGVGNGGTGVTSCAAGDFVQGNGTSPLECTNVAANDVLISGGGGVVTGQAPGATAGVPLVSQGSGSPAFSGASVAGGGTGRTNLVSGDLLVGAGASAVSQLAPGTSGNVATSNGSTWVSSPQLTISYPNTGYFTGSSGAVTTAATLLASGAFTVGSSGSALLNVSYVCANGDSLTTNQLTLGLCVDCTSAIVGGIQAGGFASGVSGSNITNASDVINPSGLTAASHTFNILAETAVTPSVNMACTAKASIRY